MSVLTHTHTQTPVFQTLCAAFLDSLGNPSHRLHVKDYLKLLCETLVAQIITV